MIEPQGVFLSEFPFIDSAFTPSSPGTLSSHWLSSGRTSISDAKVNLVWVFWVVFFLILITNWRKKEISYFLCPSFFKANFNAFNPFGLKLVIPELGLVTEHKVRRCVRAREKKYIQWAAVELLAPQATSVQLLSCWICCEENWPCPRIYWEKTASTSHGMHAPRWSQGSTTAIEQGGATPHSQNITGKSMPHAHHLRDSPGPPK